MHFWLGVAVIMVFCHVVDRVIDPSGERTFLIHKPTRPDEYVPPDFYDEDFLEESPLSHSSYLELTRDIAPRDTTDTSAEML